MWGGGQLAYVVDADVEVAQESQTSDPIVGVANLGLMVSVMPVCDPDGTNAVVEVSGALAQLDAMRTASTGTNGPLDAPTFVRATVDASAHLPSGTWAVVDGKLVEESGWIFLVRATPHAWTRTPGH